VNGSGDEVISRVGDEVIGWVRKVVRIGKVISAFDRVRYIRNGGLP
jgi:hypothetical protein